MHLKPSCVSLILFINSFLLYSFFFKCRYSNVNQLYVYMYPLFFGFPYHLHHHRVLSRVPCAVQQILFTYPFYTSYQWCIGEGNGNPLQCPCLENPMDGEAWQAAVHGVAQSRTQLKQLSSIIGVYMSIPISQFIPPPLFPFGIHTVVLYICVFMNSYNLNCHYPR